MGIGPVCYERIFGKPAVIKTAAGDEYEIPGQMTLFDFKEFEEGGVSDGDGKPAGTEG